MTVPIVESNIVAAEAGKQQDERGVEQPGEWRHAPLISGAAFALLAIAVSMASGEPAVVMVALGFWHYLLYWLAWRHGAVALNDFQRDAVSFKSVALLVLGAAYAAAPPDWLSLAVVAGGFGLNAAAARLLGADRTYFGHEIAGLPPLRLTAFPYSWVSHPMLLGNIAAYAGLLINADFRRDWWALACAHVALNVGLLAMEVFVPSGRDVKSNDRLRAHVPRWQRGCLFILPGAALGAALGAASGVSAGTWGPWHGHALAGLVLGAGAGAHLFVIHFCYTSNHSPRSFVPGRQSMEHSA